jgi:hypothetical protein
MAEGGTNSISWVAILGAVTGVLSFIWAVVKLFIDDIRKPQLAMQQPYTRYWTLAPSTNWNFVNLEVISKKGLAIGCEARAIVIQYPPNVTLVKELLHEGCGLHWSDIPYSGRSTGAERIDIGPTPQRLDIVFTELTHSGQSNLALPIALSSMLINNNIVPQAILPQGEYIFKIQVSCANGKGDSKTIKITSPNNWQDLNVQLLPKHWLKKV